ncbi:MAG: PQQ-binding-like beta-propeller repeat protein, partial [Gemmatimonadales bacterium]|nr:PQQ-binding-like beta-propeller repeat protein [Gemmatimonadales bacterium]
MLKDGTFVAVDGFRLVGIDVDGASLRWSQPISFASPAVMIDAGGSTLYTANRAGEVEAFRPPIRQDANPSPGDEPSLGSLWKFEHEGRGTPMLMPLPDGGVAVAVQNQMFGLSQGGRLMWKQDIDSRLFDWALTRERLLFTVSESDGPVWSVDRSGPMAWQAPVTGRVVVAGEGIFLYATDGIYRLDPETLDIERLYAFPRGFPSSGDIVALPDGGLLVAHQDAYDRRLIALNKDGTLRWERSVSGILRGWQRLLILGGRPFLVSQNYTSAASDEISVFAIDLDSTELTRLFTAGSRSVLPGSTSAFVVD